MELIDFEQLVSSTLTAAPAAPSALPPAGLPPAPVVEQPPVAPPPAEKGQPAPAEKKPRKKADPGVAPTKEQAPTAAAPAEAVLPGEVVLLVNARAYKVWPEEAERPLVGRQFAIESDDQFCARAAEAGYRFGTTARMNTLICATEGAAGDISLLDSIKGDEVQVDAADAIMRRAKPGSKIAVVTKASTSGFIRFTAKEVK